MIDRICISINNECNLKCAYCHFREKQNAIHKTKMDINGILQNVGEYLQKNKTIKVFKIGFVGNGEPMLAKKELKEYIKTAHGISSSIQIYTITNSTIPFSEDDILFFKTHDVNIGFSLDGPEEIHNANRENTFKLVTQEIERYKTTAGIYPTLNATVGKDTVKKTDEVISFFKNYPTRITFSRMIGKQRISLEEYKKFIEQAKKDLTVREGGLDCTMYGGLCGAGKNNFFFANGNVYICGNCVDLPPLAKSSASFFELEKVTENLSFDRTKCWKEQGKL